jgi:two-component system LytT family response regulator
MQESTEEINVCIIDDSRLARAEMRRLLANFDDINVTGEAANAEQAFEVIQRTEPGLLFLDIQMPGKDGFQLLEELDSVPQVIFVTAYNEYAVRAFEVNALDYLTKPVDPKRLNEALLKVRNSSTILPQSDEPLQEESRVFVKDGERCWFVRVGDIDLIVSNGNYAKVHFDDEHPMIHKSLSYLETRLSPDLFFRANRSQIINLKRIENVDPWFGHSIKIELANGVSVEVSRRRSKEFREKLSF